MSEAMRARQIRASGLETPAAHFTADDQMQNSRSKLVSEAEKKLYRSCTMRASYLAQDDPGIGEAVKNLARHMNQPNEANLAALKRLGRYLLKNGRYQQIFEYQQECNKVTAWTDTDYAGCPVTRKSASGGVCM